SPRMIDVARARLGASPWGDRFRFDVADAADLGGVADGSVDLALCIGALEHMLDKPAALASAARVLKPAAGRFFCLTPAGDYVRYRPIPPLPGLAPRPLPTDAFLRRAELRALLTAAGFARIEMGPWTFVPKGDMPRPAALLLAGIDALARRVPVALP